MCVNAHICVPFCVRLKLVHFFICVYFKAKFYPSFWLTRLYLLEGNTESKYYKSGHCTSNNSYNEKINTNSKL